MINKNSIRTPSLNHSFLKNQIDKEINTVQKKHFYSQSLPRKIVKREKSMLLKAISSALVSGFVLFPEIAFAASDYTPSPMDTSLIYQQLTVIAASASAFSVWWLVLVPARRTELAKEKRDKSEGSLGNYLLELREADSAATEGAVNEKGFERWLMRDWLSEKSQKKAAALPFLPKAKFNSGDNPILVATALIIGTGVFSSALDRLMH